jgi:hypothetical protein
MMDLSVVALNKMDDAYALPSNMFSKYHHPITFRISRFGDVQFSPVQNYELSFAIHKETLEVKANSSIFSFFVKKSDFFVF